MSQQRLTPSELVLHLNSYPQKRSDFHQMLKKASNFKKIGQIQKIMAEIHEDNNREREKSELKRKISTYLKKNKAKNELKLKSENEKKYCKKIFNKISLGYGYLALDQEYDLKKNETEILVSQVYGIIGTGRNKKNEEKTEKLKTEKKMKQGDNRSFHERREENFFVFNSTLSKHKKNLLIKNRNETISDRISKQILPSRSEIIKTEINLLSEKNIYITEIPNEKEKNEWKDTSLEKTEIFLKNTNGKQAKHLPPVLDLKKMNCLKNENYNGKVVSISDRKGLSEHQNSKNVESPQNFNQEKSEIINTSNTAIFSLKEKNRQISQELRKTREENFKKTLERLKMPFEKDSAFPLKTSLRSGYFGYLLKSDYFEKQEKKKVLPSHHYPKIEVKDFDLSNRRNTSDNTSSTNDLRKKNGIGTFIKKKENTFENIPLSCRSEIKKKELMDLRNQVSEFCSEVVKYHDSEAKINEFRNDLNQNFRFFNENFKSIEDELVMRNEHLKSKEFENIISMDIL